MMRVRASKILASKPLSQLKSHNSSSPSLFSWRTHFSISPFMAANSNTIRGVASLHKRLVNQVRTTTRDPPPSLPCALRRKAHTSVYDKNVEEQVRPAVVPDDIVQQKSEYWAPHPHTGVFGPSSVGSDAAANTGGRGSSESSVLEQKAFFRDLENLDKPQHP